MLRPTSSTSDVFRKKGTFLTDTVTTEIPADDISFDLIRRTPPIPVAMGLDGPSAHMRRLPSLKPRSTGTWSAPALLTGMPGGEIGLAPLWSPSKDMRAKTASSEDMYTRRGLETPARKKTVYVCPGPPIKNPGVWQRWQVNVPSNRMQREEVLERDRERQREHIDLTNRRSFASPARSHAASLFFASVPGGGEVDCLPLGAMRRVARPQTRQMNQLTNIATGSAVSSTNDPSSKKTRAGDRTPRPAIPDELQNEDLVFEGDETNELTDLIDAYATLTAGVDQGSFLASMAGSLSTCSSLVQSPNNRSDTAGLKQRAADDPMILRPTFCRFLLASKLCGDATSLHKYHESVATFDKFAQNLGAYTGVTRGVMVLLLARMLRIKGEAGVPAIWQDEISRNPMFDGLSTDLLDGRPNYIKYFFMSALPNAMDHADFRKMLSEQKEKEMHGVQAGEVPANVLAEVSSGSLWPPLPPRSVKEPQLPEWMSGVRRWQEDLEQQNPQGLLRLRRYTETVLRGEILGSQLLEPEVLHFAARFRPLFGYLFQAYADWPSPQILVEAAEDGIIEGDLEMHKKGHLSFTSFFRFCVDFGIFPGHASFEEIRQIYNDAEAVVEVPQPSPPTTPSAVEEQGRPDSAGFERDSDKVRRVKSGGTDGGAADKSKDQKASGAKKAAGAKATSKRTTKAGEEADGVPDKNGGKKGAARPQSPDKASDRPNTSSSERPGSQMGGRGAKRENGGARASVAKVEDADKVALKPAPHMFRSKKALQAAQIAEAAAKAAAEAKVPKADLAFMEKPLSSMSDIELRSICFFAGVDEWLSERFARFADLLNDVNKEDSLHTSFREDKAGPSTEKSDKAEKMEKVASSSLRSDKADSRPESRSERNASDGAGDGNTSPGLSDKDGLACLGDNDESLEVIRELPAEVVALQNQLLKNSVPEEKPGQRRNSGAERHLKMMAQAAAMAAAQAAMAVPPIEVITAPKLLEVIAPMGMANRPSEEELEEIYAFVLKAPKEQPRSPTKTRANPKPPTLGISVFQMDKILRTARAYMGKARLGCCALLRADSELRPHEKEVVKFLHELSALLLDRSGFMGITEDFLDDCGKEFAAWKLVEKAVALGIDALGEDENGFRKYPATEDREKFSAMLIEQIEPGRGDGKVRRSRVYRALALVKEGRRTQRHVELLSQLRCLAGDPSTQHSGPSKTLFGLAAFAECLLKLALHRLGGKGSNEIQRGSPAWWKCAWLIAVLSGEFKDQLKRHSHEKQIAEYAQMDQDTASPRKIPEKKAPPAEQRKIVRSSTSEYKMRDSPSGREARTRISTPAVSTTNLRGSSDGFEDAAYGGSPMSKDKLLEPVMTPKRRHTATTCNVQDTDDAENKRPRMSPLERRAKEVDTWHHRSYTDQMPRYITPLEQLVIDMPSLFDPGTGEANVPNNEERDKWPVVCQHCNESASPSGWGTPGCASCSGVEELCLPISGHLFSSLLRTPSPDMPEAFGEDSFGEDDEDDSEFFPFERRRSSLFYERRNSRHSNRRQSETDTGLGT